MKTCNVLQTCSKKQILHSKTYNHDVYCTNTHKCLNNLYKVFKSRGHLYEIIISTCNPIRKRMYPETSRMKTCSASQACSKKEILYTKTYNHYVYCTKTHKHFKNLFGKVYVKRPFRLKHNFNLQK